MPPLLSAPIYLGYEGLYIPLAERNGAWWSGLHSHGSNAGYLVYRHLLERQGSKGSAGVAALPFVAAPRLV